MHRAILSFAAAGVLAIIPVSTTRAAVVQVTAFGQQGWRSDDTRSSTGANLVGINDTNAPKPGQTPTAADDTAIGQQIQFVTGPIGSTYGGAISTDGTTSNSGKSNISVINTATGFDSASNLLSTFSASYEWYGLPNPTTRTLGFKLGIQSTSWGSGAGESQDGFTALRSGESAWDLVLVYTGNTSDNAWTTESVDHDTGTWNLYRQSGNTFFAAPSATAMTLDDWANDATFGPLLFGTGAKVTSIQFGLGSGQKQSIAYLDYVQTNLLNGGDAVDFTVPEPASLSLLGAGLLMFLPRSKRSRRGV